MYSPDLCLYPIASSPALPALSASLYCSSLYLLTPPSAQTAMSAAWLLITADWLMPLVTALLLMS